MKKYFNRMVISNILMFISLMILSIYMFIYSSKIVNASLYGFTGMHYKLIWLGFSLSWILWFLSLIDAFKGWKRIIAYLIINMTWIVVFVVQICYVKQLGKFMLFNDLFLAGEGLQYVKSVLLHLNPGMVVIALISFLIMVFTTLYNKKYAEEDKYAKSPKIYIIVLLILGLSLRIGSIIGLGSATSPNTWQENYNAKNIYNNFVNQNANMYLTGLYEYDIRGVYKYFYNILTLDKSLLKKDIDQYNTIYGYKNSRNEYSGIFKDKNIIYIMMESIDSWIIDKDTMPNLYRLKKEGLNFTNRYSPFFNGGQTINSEFALNTGLYSISDFDTIYDIDDVHYPYSLANMFKNKGYSVNSFHANNSSFYNRGEFHKRLGYDHHYSAYDMQKAGILDKDINYYADSNMLSDNTIFKLMSADKPFLAFITTYSAHLEYSESNKVYVSVEHPFADSDMNQEEQIYRTLAYDTDKAIGILMDKLEKHHILDDTVLVLVSDHYVYGYSDSDYVALKKQVLNDRHELQNTPFIIWSKDIESKDIDTILDTADILPTILNMADIEYDPKNYMGTDVFSANHDHFVWFEDASFIKDDECLLSDEAILTKSNLSIKKNKNILLTDYYGK